MNWKNVVAQELIEIKEIVEKVVTNMKAIIHLLSNKNLEYTCMMC